MNISLLYVNEHFQLSKTNIMTTRRKFLNDMALSSSALLLPHSLIQGQKKKLGVALVGLGNYATNHLAPALKETKLCHLTAIVTGSKSKVPDFKDKYGITDDHVYSYENFDEIVNDELVDIVYVVTPNALHQEYTIRAAQAGKHVICEKPMEINADRAREMVEACDDAGVKLQIGYRCQYDPTHQRLMQLGRDKVFGSVNVVESGFSFYGLNSDNWRFTDASLSGGGPMMDIGIYCVQGCRYATGQDPIRVTAQTFKKFKDKLPGMEETITWQFLFDDGTMANCTCSYAGRHDALRVSTEEGWYGLDPAYSYAMPQLTINGEVQEKIVHNQKATQMDAFAKNILEDTPVIADGMMGWKDMVIVDAVYKAAQTGRAVDIEFRP